MALLLLFSSNKLSRLHFVLPSDHATPQWSVSSSVCGLEQGKIIMYMLVLKFLSIRVNLNPIFSPLPTPFLYHNILCLAFMDTLRLIPHRWSE